MVPIGIQNIGAEEEIRQLIKDLEELYESTRSNEEFRDAWKLHKSRPGVGISCPCCCYKSPKFKAFEIYHPIKEEMLNREYSIINRFNTHGKARGYFVEWKMEHPPHLDDPIKVGLSVKLNFTKSREFCVDNGIEFVSPYGPNFGVATIPMTNNPDPFPIVSEQPPSYTETFMNYEKQ